MKEEEKFICPLCQELHEEEIPMRPGVYKEKVGKKTYFVVRGGLVCTKNPLHFISGSDYRSFQRGEISRIRIIEEMKEKKDDHLTPALLKFFGREK